MGALDAQESIETASLDELRALQLDRLKSAVARAYDRVPHTRAKFDAAGVHPKRPEVARRSRPFSLHDQGRSARNLPVRHVRRADGRDRTRPCIERHDGQADRRRLYHGRHRHLGEPDGAVDPRRGREFAPISSTMPMATGSSPADLASTMARNGSARRWCRRVAARPSGTCGSSRIFAPTDHHRDAVLSPRPSPTNSSARGSIRVPRAFASPSAAPSRGARRCATKSRHGFGLAR